MQHDDESRYPNTWLFNSPFVYYGMVATMAQFAERWGDDTTRWPYSAVPTYRLVIGTYIRGEGTGRQHVMFTTDEAGTSRVPMDSREGQSSWVAWHEEKGTRYVPPECWAEGTRYPSPSPR